MGLSAALISSVKRNTHTYFPYPVSKYDLRLYTHYKPRFWYSRECYWRKSSGMWRCVVGL